MDLYASAPLHERRMADHPSASVWVTLPGAPFSGNVCQRMSRMREVLSAHSMNFPACVNHQPSLRISVAWVRPIRCRELLLISWKKLLGLSFQACLACGVRTNQ